MRWGTDCVGVCFSTPTQGKDEAGVNLVSTNFATEFEYPDLSSVPSCYHHLQEVFNKTKAMSLPPCRPYHCTINPIPGSTIPKGRLYSVSGPEKKAMKD